MMYKIRKAIANKLGQLADAIEPAEKMLVVIDRSKSASDAQSIIDENTELFHKIAQAQTN